VFEKTQFKVLKWASTLCGIILSKYSSPPPAIQNNETSDEIIIRYQQANHPLLNETREDRLIKN